MKRFILFTFSILFAFSLAIAQDGINYQGAATDANGDELTNQNISIRASVLSGSASGNLEWEENHSATTDQFGLFNVVIGQGTNTTNGATALFDDMDWGSGNHYLKIEMDATGGTNYAMIGTTQMMSVPYALYAKSAGIDSTMLANMIGSSVGGMGGGCDFLYPDGLDGISVTETFNSANPYIVPVGKRLYVLTSYQDVVIENMVDGFVVPHGNPVILNSGEALSSGSTNNNKFNGYLVDEKTEVTAVTGTINSANPYIVPVGKRLYVLASYEDVLIEGIAFGGIPSGKPVILNSGEALSSGSTNTNYFNGYLVDENYFANCGGGGGSSSASAVDSAMVAGMIANAGGGGGSLEIDTIYYNLDQVSSGFFGAHYFDTLDISQDGFIFARSHVTSSGQASNPNYCTFIIHYGFNLEEDSRLIGQETTNSRMIPVKQGMKLCLYSFLNNDSDLDLFFITNNSGGGGGSSSSTSAVDSAMVAGMIANSSSNNSNQFFQGVLDASSICIEADTAFVINFNQVQGDGITSIEMDDSDNIYMTLSAQNHPNHGGSGGEVRKYDSTLNLIWTRTYSSNSPENIKFCNGALFVCGNQGWTADDFVSRLDPQTGSDIWTDNLNFSGGNSNLLECNDTYVCMVTSDGGNGGRLKVYDFNGSVIYDGTMNSGYPLAIALDNSNLLYVSSYDNIRTYNILSSPSSYSYSLSVGNHQSDSRDMLLHQGQFIRSHYFYNSSNNMSSEQEFYTYNAPLSSSSTNAQYEIKTGVQNSANYPKEKFKSHLNGFSFLLNSSGSQVNILNQYILQNFDNSQYGNANGSNFALLDFDNNFNIIGVKNLMSLKQLRQVQFAVSSNKHAVSFDTENESICINGNNYSGIVLMIY